MEALTCRWCMAANTEQPRRGGGGLCRGSAAGEKLPFIPPVSVKHKLVIYTYIQLREKEERTSSPAEHSDQRTGREGGVRDTSTKPRERGFKSLGVC